ncbi:RNA-binding protein 44 isoform X1 [Scyliorhinus torazame]
MRTTGLQTCLELKWHNTSRMQSESMEDVQEPRISSELNQSRMPTFYCIWPCEKCSYCNTLSTRKCRNCSEPMRDEEQSLYLEDKNMLLAHNQRILTSYSSVGKGFPCFKAVGPNSGNRKTNEEGTCDEFNSGIKPRAFDRGLRTECDKEIVETKCQLSNTLELSYETSSDHGSSVVEDLAKETGVLTALEQEQCNQKLVFVNEYGNDSILSLDTEFDMYRKLNEMTLQQVSGDLFQEIKRETPHQYIPDKDSGTFDLEPFPNYYSMNSTESTSFADFFSHEELSPEKQTPAAYPDAPNPEESDQFAHCCPLAEEIDETSFISAITSHTSFVHKSNEIAFCECAERPADSHLVDCKSIGISEGRAERVINDRNVMGPNGSKLERVEGVRNSNLQTEVLLESVNQSELCFPNQIEEFANDESACSASTDIESENQVPLVSLNVMDAVVSTSTISEAEDASQNQRKQSSNTASACESPDHPGWGNSCELAAVSCEISDSDHQKFFDDSFVSAADDSIIASVTVTDHNTDLTGQENDVLGPLEITECNRFSDCISDSTVFGRSTLIEGTCTHNQEKCEHCFKKGTKGLIIKVDQYVDVSRDFRTDFTVDKDTTAMISVVDRADNTDITLMSKNRPTLGQRRKYGNVACNTKWSIVESTVKQQSTQTAKVTTEEKSINTILQTTDFDSHAKVLGTSQCKTKLRKVLDELEELKKKYKSTELLQQSSLYLSATEDGSTSSVCCDSMKQRAIKAELQLLKMQYWMCQQHCWRVYNMAVEERSLRDLGLPFLEVGTEYGAAVSSALQELKTNYQSARQKVMEGLSLDSLPLLSVELKGLSCAAFVPAMLGEQQPMSQCQNNSNYRDRIAEQEVPSQETAAKKLVGAKEEADVLSDEPQTDHYQHVGHKVEAKNDCENIVKRGAKDPEVTDDWFDAKENFTASCAFTVMQMKANGKDRTMPAEEDRTRSDASARTDKETAQTCYIYIDGLPRTVTEMELRRLFQKYQVSGIWLCSLHSEYRCGVLRVGSPNYAKLTVEEMNGKEYHGKRIEVHLAKISGDHMLSVLKNHSQSPLKVDSGKGHTAKETDIKVDSQCSVPISTRIINAASHKMNRRKHKTDAVPTGHPHRNRNIAFPQTLLI